MRDKGRKIKSPTVLLYNNGVLAFIDTAMLYLKSV
jgi:hypothetical protein